MCGRKNMAKLESSRGLWSFDGAGSVYAITDAPKLLKIVTFVPEPGTLWLLIFGGLRLLVWRGRQLCVQRPGRRD